MAEKFDAQISEDTKAQIRSLFDRRLVRPAGALFMAEQAGEDVSGLTRVHVAAWLASR